MDGNSCDPLLARLTEPICDRLGSPHYLAAAGPWTVTKMLSNAWLPLASVARMVTWWLPGWRPRMLNAAVSSGESQMLSDGSTACQSFDESTLYSAPATT